MMLFPRFSALLVAALTAGAGTYLPAATALALTGPGKSSSPVGSPTSDRKIIVSGPTTPIRAALKALHAEATYVTSYDRAACGWVLPASQIFAVHRVLRRAGGAVSRKVTVSAYAAPKFIVIGPTKQTNKIADKLRSWGAEYVRSWNRAKSGWVLPASKLRAVRAELPQHCETHNFGKSVA